MYQAKRERNFHIFYNLVCKLCLVPATNLICLRTTTLTQVRGASDKERARWRLQDVKDFRLLMGVWRWV